MLGPYCSIAPERYIRQAQNRLLLPRTYSLTLRIIKPQMMLICNVSTPWKKNANLAIPRQKNNINDNIYKIGVNNANIYTGWKITLADNCCYQCVSSEAQNINNGFLVPI